MSDVPLGAFLSGGIDSSSVVAMMAEALPADSVKTFSIGFAESSFDESAHARRVAEHFGTDHREHVFTPRDMVDVLPTIADVLDEPLADASILPTYLLSRFTREHVTVALGGDGGDELLAGYPTFFADRVASLYVVPQVLHERVVRAARRPAPGLHRRLQRSISSSSASCAARRPARTSGTRCGWVRSAPRSSGGSSRKRAAIRTTSRDASSRRRRRRIASSA